MCLCLYFVYKNRNNMIFGYARTLIYIFIFKRLLMNHFGINLLKKHKCL
jgi:hypothetical protein